MFTEMGCKDVDQIHLNQYRIQWLAFVNTVMHIEIPGQAKNVFVSRTTVVVENDCDSQS